MAYLEALIPTTDLIAWYNLEEVTDARLASLADASTGARNLTAVGSGSDRPLGVTDVLNGYPIVRFDNVSPFLNTTSPPVVHDIFIVAKYTLAANFGGAYRGLISGETAGDALVGDSAASSTKFLNIGTGTSFYYKSQTAYAAAAQEAPFAQFELLRYGDTAGIAFDGIQLGNHKALTAYWRGDVADVLLYGAVQSAANARRIALFYDLKYRLWLTNSTTLYFPDPTTTGIYWRKFDETPLDWDDVTESHEYQDKGRSFNTFADTPPRVWSIDYSGLTPEEAEVFDAFNDAARRDRTFSLIDKWGVTWTGVRIRNYSRGHDDHKSWSKNVSFTLVKYP